jgi:nitrogen fixation protein NifU and related proteins
MTASAMTLIEMYRELISDHTERPRNFREMVDATRHAKADNPICGDMVTLWLKIDSNTISEASFQGSGCSICMSSASMLTEAVVGKDVDEAHEMFDRFHRMLTSPIDAPIDEESMGKLACFGGVRKYPIRVKCATLPWHALENLIRPRMGTNEHE